MLFLFHSLWDFMVAIFPLSHTNSIHNWLGLFCCNKLWRNKVVLCAYILHTLAFHPIRQIFCFIPILLYAHNISLMCANEVISPKCWTITQTHTQSICIKSINFNPEFCLVFFSESLGFQRFAEQPKYTEVNPGQDALLTCKIIDKRGSCSWQKNNKVRNGCGGCAPAPAYDYIIKCTVCI